MWKCRKSYREKASCWTWEIEKVKLSKDVEKVLYDSWFIDYPVLKCSLCKQSWDWKLTCPSTHQTRCHSDVKSYLEHWREDRNCRFQSFFQLKYYKTNKKQNNKTTSTKITVYLIYWKQYRGVWLFYTKLLPPTMLQLLKHLFQEWYWQGQFHRHQQKIHFKPAKATAK